MKTDHRSSVSSVGSPRRVSVQEGFPAIRSLRRETASSEKWGRRRRCRHSEVNRDWRRFPTFASWCVRLELNAPMQSANAGVDGGASPRTGFTVERLEASRRHGSARFAGAFKKPSARSVTGGPYQAVRARSDRRFFTTALLYQMGDRRAVSEIEPVYTTWSAANTTPAPLTAVGANSYIRSEVR